MLIKKFLIFHNHIICFLFLGDLIFTSILFYQFMNKYIILLMIIYLLTFLSFFTLVLCENTNFNYTKHGDDWNDTACRTGKYQSPILLKSTAQISDSFLFADYSKAQAQIAFYNTTTYINGAVFGSAYTLTKDGRAIAFKANQIRLRCQSQHAVQDSITFEPKKYALQLQIYHTLLYPSPTNDRFVIALFFEEDPEYQGDPFLQSIIKAEQNQSNNIQVDLSQYLKKANNYDFWFYLGSITQPYCTENQYNWVIIKQPFKLSTEQNQYFHASFYNNKQIEGNWRNLQNNNNPLGFYSHLTDN